MKTRTGLTSDKFVGETRRAWQDRRPRSGRPNPTVLLGGAEIDFTHNGSATPVAETGTASAARGLPDLGTAIAVDGGALYRAAEEPGHFLHVASALRVAGLEDGSGLPDLSLELVRGKTPSAPPKPYGVLDLRVAAGEPAPGALEAARGQDPRAFITPALFGNGFVRLQVVAGQGALAPALREELAQPVALASNGLDSTRLIRRLTPEAALLLRGALIDGALTVVAVAELSLRGLAERLPATVSFSPRTLLDALLQRADSQQRIAVSAITDLWAGGAPLLASTGTDGVEPRQLAQALTDWTIAAYAVPAAAAGAEVAPTVQLKRPATFEPKLTWDLSRGRTTTRMLVLRLDPFEAARELGGKQFWHETIVPALETGITQIDVDTNFPHPMVNVARAGVQMRAAPFPPDRVNELSAGLLFDAREAPQAVKWRLSAKEQLKYTYACFAFVRLGSTTKRVDKPTVTSTARRLLLGVDDLPVDLVPVAAGERLLADASVHGALTDGTTRVEFALTSAQPRVSVALLPGTAERFSLALEARPLAGGAPVALAPLPARASSSTSRASRSTGRRPWTSPSTSTSTCRWWHSSCCPSATVMTPRRRRCWRSHPTSRTSSSPISTRRRLTPATATGCTGPRRGRRCARPAARWRCAPPRSRSLRAAATSSSRTSTAFRPPSLTRHFVIPLRPGPERDPVGGRW